MVQRDEWKNGWDTGVQVKIKLKQPLDKNIFLNFTSVYNYHACHSVIMFFLFFFVCRCWNSPKIQNTEASCGIISKHSL